MIQDHPNMPPEGWAWPSCHSRAEPAATKTSDVLFHCYVKNANFTPNLKSASLPHSSPWSVCAGWIALDHVFPDEHLWAESPVCIRSLEGQVHGSLLSHGRATYKGPGIAVCQCLQVWALLAHSKSWLFGIAPTSCICEGRTRKRGWSFPGNW